MKDINQLHKALKVNLSELTTHSAKTKKIYDFGKILVINTNYLDILPDSATYEGGWMSAALKLMIVIS